jgi:hypothetical protein
MLLLLVLLLHHHHVLHGVRHTRHGTLGACMVLWACHHGMRVHEMGVVLWVHERVCGRQWYTHGMHGGEALRQRP